MADNNKNRATSLNAIRQSPQVDVLIIGGGINGIGTFRELALQGVRVLLVDKADFCSGASAASSHMLHGGIRYLENGEFRLVREALHERNRLLHNAPHYARPLPTTIPMFRWFSGMLNAPLKFIRLLDRPAERGAVIIKAGLMLYDLFTGPQQIMPFHTFRGRKSALEKYPQLNPEIVCTATYYDAWMPYPERLCLEMILDCEASSDQAYALNYVSAVDGEGERVILRDELTGETFDVMPKIVINAGGPWIDFVNRALGEPTRFIGGTKGSHVVLDHPQLREAIGETEFFFENKDGRIVLIFPYYDRVMLGTTDIRIDNPDEAICTDDEIDYMIGMIGKVFPAIQVTQEHIVFRFSGVRPLPASEEGRTGAISRDHSIRTVEADENLKFAVHSMIGGKWTTFRAFSAQAADLALRALAVPRRFHTAELPIGGGRNYPPDEGARQLMLEQLEARTEVPMERLKTLFERYGTYVSDVAEFIGRGNDQPLEGAPDYSRREILFLAERESVGRLDDVLLRRTLLGMLGYVNLTPQLIETVADIVAQAQGWDAERRASEIERVQALMAHHHGLEVPVKAE